MMKLLLTLTYLVTCECHSSEERLSKEAWDSFIQSDSNNDLQTLNKSICYEQGRYAEKFPFIVFFTNDTTIHCLGTLFAYDYVLTSAHCIEKTALDLVLHIKTIGTNPYHSDINFIEYFIIHPKYSVRNNQIPLNVFDLALVKLKKPIENYSFTANLHFNHFDNYNDVYYVFTLIGSPNFKTRTDKSWREIMITKISVTKVHLDPFAKFDGCWKIMKLLVSGDDVYCFVVKNNKIKVGDVMGGGIMWYSDKKFLSGIHTYDDKLNGEFIIGVTLDGKRDWFRKILFPMNSSEKVNTIIVSQDEDFKKANLQLTHDEDVLQVKSRIFINKYRIENVTSGTAVGPLLNILFVKKYQSTEISNPKRLYYSFEDEKTTQSLTSVKVKVTTKPYSSTESDFIQNIVITKKKISTLKVKSTTDFFPGIFITTKKMVKKVKSTKGAFSDFFGKSTTTTFLPPRHHFLPKICIANATILKDGIFTHPEPPSLGTDFNPEMFITKEQQSATEPYDTETTISEPLTTPSTTVESDFNSEIPSSQIATNAEDLTEDNFEWMSQPLPSPSKSDESDFNTETDAEELTEDTFEWLDFTKSIPASKPFPISTISDESDSNTEDADELTEDDFEWFDMTTKKPILKPLLTPSTSVVSDFNTETFITNRQRSEKTEELTKSSVNRTDMTTRRQSNKTTKWFKIIDFQTSKIQPEETTTEKPNTCCREPMLPEIVYTILNKLLLVIFLGLLIVLAIILFFLL